jgi:hypothetical protein
MREQQRKRAGNNYHEARGNKKKKNIKKHKKHKNIKKNIKNIKNINIKINKTQKKLNRSSKII